jgi:hypothetical protein
MVKVTFSNGKELTKCCICSKFFEGYGNNPDPVTDEDGKFFKEDDECCSVCNNTVVIPKRMKEMLG